MQFVQWDAFDRTHLDALWFGEMADALGASSVIDLVNLNAL